ncbi:hypothetical protein GI374_04490 [Paracoccus sp. S-4012]|uniref:hypothetical protein n=1 Tax=Paracoccus sp. S-4012 TaxID=2665648 RepID=UPI0012B0F966|nr:hypothetical protein [Paracoccus sp. S-4012]MRX49718.1 hypothetical protein [Paracoccus sp. S-4012]
MSSSDALPRRAVLAGLALLAGCGFTPAYAPGGAGTALRGRVRPQAPTDADQFAFNARLTERLGPPSAAAYGLSYSLSLAVTPQHRGFDDVVTRQALNGSADYTLTDLASGAVVASGQVSSFAAYEAGGTTVAALAAEADARARLATMLADEVVTRLLAATAAR